jgi:hypothetical protein
VPRSHTSDCHNRLRGLTAPAAHLLSFLLVFVMASARADEPVKPASRAEATAIIANARKIVTPNGVERWRRCVLTGLINGSRSPARTAGIRCCYIFTADPDTSRFP